jgi:hypothetical protein
MGLLEEIQRMRQVGMQDDQIVLKLQEQGNTYRAISEAMSQSKIKQAVEYSEEQQLPQVPESQQQADQPYQEQQEYFSGYNPQSQVQQSQEYQQQYDYPSNALSSDTITEISEQIVSEKLSDIRKKLEKISSFKTELETKAESIDERLKRIEKIIDTLQASVLRKVGDYVTNVEDIKHELIETQKTFAKVLGQKHHKEHKH